MIKKILSICIVWLSCLTLWGQSTGGYGGDYNPTRPDDPAAPVAKYRLTVTSTEGGTVSPAISNAPYTEGTSVRVSATAQTNYKFVHWTLNDVVVATTTSYNLKMPANDVVLKAVFEYYGGQYGNGPTTPGDPNATTRNYKLTVSCSPANGGSVSLDKSSATAGVDMRVTATLNANYKFKGWFDEGVLVSTEPVYKFKMEGRDMNLVAKYEYAPTKPGNPTGSGTVTTRQLTFQIDGNTYLQQSLAPGQKIVLPDTPIRKGHTFDGWEAIPDVMPEENLTINGSFSINRYKIKFVIDGRGITQFLEYGAKIVPPDVWPAEDEVFTWIDLPAIMPDHDIVINGEYTPVKYALIYVVDGVEYRRVEYQFGETVVPIQEPLKDGYVFSGWSNVPLTMPATYVVVNGSFIDPNQERFQVTFIVDGEFHHIDSVAAGTQMSHVNMPAKEGYTFNIDNEVPAFMPPYDITIEASFSINKYKLTYVVDGKLYKEYVYDYNTPITEEAAPSKDGCAFTGWSEIPDSMPARNVTVTGDLILNGYTVTYMVDDEVHKKIVYSYGSEVEPLNPLSKEGYTFSGWSEIPKTMPANDVTVEGRFTVNKYAVIYMVNGSILQTDTVDYEANIVIAEDPIREGYTFSGWSKGPEVMPARDVTITGTFLINTYQFTYTVDSATYHTVSIEYGEKIIPIDIPKKEGHTFSGWIEIPQTMPARDVTVNGNFSVNTYRISYSVDGNVYQIDSVEYNEEITVIDNPTQEGYTFSGWSKSPEKMPANDITITGSFSINTYQITYTVEGLLYHTETITYNETITPAEQPSKEGYSFSGWVGLPATMPANDVIVTGSYLINKYKITYTVDGEVYDTDSIEYGEKVIVVDWPTEEGYSFSGWTGVPSTMPANDVTVTGTFTINKYEITYTVDGERHHTDSIEFGDKIIAVDAPTKEGYTFGGWSEIPRTMPANDVAITGSFLINKYKITYVVEGEVHETDSITFGAYVTAARNPSKEGHTFDGWTGVPSTMPANDVTVTGTFSINKYKITYTVDGMVHYTDSIEYDERIVAIEAPTKEGYTFGGWQNLPQKMPARDVTSAGAFNINTYQISYVVEGETIHTESITYNEQITTIDYPEKEGFTFSGWIGVPITMPANDLTIGGEFFIKTSQTDTQGLMYTLNEETETFEVSNYADALMTSIVIPADLYGYPVSGIKNRALMGAESLISVIVPENVTSVGYRAFYGCHNLSYIEWKTTAPVDADCFDEPARHGNLLVYVENEATEVTYLGNVIVNGVAEKITISNDQPFRNIREFTARNISFTREFSKRTKIGEAGGWEAIIIPFDVETIVSENRGELKPFGEADFNTSLPYWIAELQTDGSFAYIDSIKANSPFIMEVPNSDEYRDIYNVEGMITFSAKNTTVHSTDITLPTTQGFAMMGSYEGTTSDSRTYALNDEEYTAGGVTSMAGSVFVANSRDIRPFEAYVYSNQVALAPYLRIGSDNATGIGHMQLDLNDDDAWYTLQGVRLNGRPLEKGSYIHQNKVVFIK